LSSRARRLRRAAAVAFGICTLAGPAFAQTPSEIERAKQSFRAGAAAYAAGEYLTAIQALDAAYTLTPLPAIGFSLAQAERRQYFVSHEPAHLSRAILLFREYVNNVPQGGRRADALDALSQLEPLSLARERESSPAPVEADAVRRTRVMILSETPGARLSLDGGPAAGSPLIREVSPGQHRVTAEAKGFFSSEHQVTALDGELVVLPVRLLEQPSRLSLSTRESAEVYIDGTFASQGGARLSLELPSGTHRVVVAEKGYRVAERTLDLDPGETRALPMQLERTRQRKAALTLFITGGAALGATVLLSALAIRAENDAETYLGRRSQGNLSPAELDEYHDAVELRDRFRLATYVTLASAGGLFVTGLFLYELDKPDPKVVYKKPTPGEREAPSARLRVAPIVGSHALGALVRQTF
jgi:hypothetical protein